MTRTPVTKVDPNEIEYSAIRAQGAGGQNVNKVSTAVHARLDIKSSSLPEPVKTRLLSSRDARITDDGVLVIKAQRYRSQQANKLDALTRIQAIVDDASTVRAVRRPTRPTKASSQRRLDSKLKRGKQKGLRRVDWQD